MLSKFLHFVVPQESNNHKAKLLHSSSFLVICLLMIVYQLAITLVPHLHGNVLGYASSISADEVIRLTNEKRVAAGLSPLTTNSVLSQAALAKGNYMIEKDFWAHVAPDGTQPWKFFSDFGYKYSYAGENLAKDFSNAPSAVEAWMNSTTHKENMLSPKYKEIGIGVVEGDVNGVDTTIIVQFFGTRYGDQLPTAPVAQVLPTVTPTPTAVASKAPASLATPSPVPLASPILETPTPAPTSLVASEQNEPESTGVLISPFVTTKGISLIVVGILLVVLVVDALIVSKRRIARIGGRTFAHFAFLGMILAIALILKVGRVI